MHTLMGGSDQDGGYDALQSSGSCALERWNAGNLPHPLCVSRQIRTIHSMNFTIFDFGVDLPLPAIWATSTCSSRRVRPGALQPDLVLNP